MLVSQDFICTNPECEHIFEEFLDKRNGEFEYNPPCPKCFCHSQPCLGNPKHHRHVSHSTWRMGHGS